MNRTVFFKSTPLKTSFCILLGAFFALSCYSTFAESGDIYQCTDANGKTEFRNTGDIKGCKKLSVEPVVIPKLAPNAKANPAAGQNFPKVDSTTQKNRDNDRKRILEEELKAQQTKLADLKKTYNNGEPERQGDERNFQKYLDRVQKMKEDIGRSESDVQSIKSEIDKIQ